MNRRMTAFLAAYTTFTGMMRGGPRTPAVSSKTEKLIKECRSIKGMSAKEMGTSGKGKRLSRAQRKKKNIKKRSR